VNVITLEVRMDGDPQAVKEIAAMELENILLKVDRRASVRVTGVREEREEQMQMRMERR